MKPDEAAAVARYHAEGIPSGVLAELGVDFMTDLYRAIDKSPYGFVFVALDSSETVRGFVCGTTRLGAVMRGVLLRRGWKFAGYLRRWAFSGGLLGRAFEAVFYPSKMKADLPEAELLSVVVDSEFRGSGAAGGLMDALMGEFRARGVRQVKVMVGARLDRANAYYVKHGFRLAAQISTHGQPANVYVTDIA
ncbi:MAG: GNAT family N-acetyltransferase [Planctomycetes bacterium]|nr:GNAT family N-acetyltransferase [Planctomycetota bacterium]